MLILWKTACFCWSWLGWCCGDILRRRQGVGLAAGDFALCLHFEQAKSLMLQVLRAEGPGGKVHLASYLTFSFRECCEHHKTEFESAFTRGNRIRHDREHDAETSETVNSNSAQCKHCWTASKLVVGHLCSTANGQTGFLTAQESFLHGEGSLQRHVQPFNWGATGWRDVSEGEEQ